MLRRKAHADRCFWPLAALHGPLVSGASGLPCAASFKGAWPPKSESNLGEIEERAQKIWLQRLESERIALFGRLLQASGLLLTDHEEKELYLTFDAATLISSHTWSICRL